MVVEAARDRSRPYAAPANIIAVLNRVRSRNLPEAINNDFLRIAGVPEATLGRVAQALRFLGLCYEDGRPTDTLQKVSGAPDADYRELLAGAIREAYREDLAVVDPGHDKQARIIDAFRPYQPRSQTARMVMLFLGLCREAAIPVLDAPRDRRMRATGVRQSTPRSRQSVRPPSAPPLPPASYVPGPQVVFTLMQDDLALLEGKDFDEVWLAVGKVQLARARAKRAEAASARQGVTEGEVDN